MATDTSHPHGRPVARALTRVVVYYALLFALGWIARGTLPRGGTLAQSSLDLLFGSPPPVAATVAVVAEVGESRLAIMVAVAMISAILLSLPVAWVYVLTRAKRGYQQSVVHLLIVLPLVVSGIVMLVKDSLALAFSLAGIVAAVRFRNTLDDSKDAVYVFLATAIGLAAAVNVPVAAVISVLFNLTVLTLWYTDFAHTPVELDGRIAKQRLREAKQLARTGSFVARIDQEIFRDMTREQLEGVAERAWRRAHEEEPEPGNSTSEIRLRIRTNDVTALRQIIEPRLDDHVRRWRFTGAVPAPDGSELASYAVQLKKKTTPDDLLALVRSAGGSALIDVELT